jgi:predicted hotdog family 3-hydroxylacyl-ACP dehydratase
MTSTHTHANNPLRAENRLGALCGVEYAAQAVAIHGAILNCEGGPGQGPTHPMHGYLVALRDVDVRVERLDNLPEELEIVAVRVAALAGGASYRYVIRRGPETLQSGRLTLRFTAAAAQESGVRA